SVHSSSRPRGLAKIGAKMGAVPIQHRQPAAGGPIRDQATAQYPTRNRAAARLGGGAEQVPRRGKSGENVTRRAWSAIGCLPCFPKPSKSAQATSAAERPRSANGHVLCSVNGQDCKQYLEKRRQSGRLHSGFFLAW